MTTQNQRLYLLGEEKVGKSLIKLGIPSIVGMLVSALYNLVDTYFVARLGTSQIGAVSIVFPVSMVVLGFALMFGAGASSCLSRLLGSKQFKKADIFASTALASSMIFSLILVAVMLIFSDPLLRLLGATETMMPYAREYAFWFFIGLMFNVFNITANNIFTSEGATVVAMNSMLAGSIANVILDPIMIFGMNMGVRGAAIATLISRLISVGIYVFYFASKRSNYHISLRNVKPEGELYTEILKIGMPMLFMHFLTSVAMSLTNRCAASYGDSAVAAFGVVMRVFSVGQMIVTGFLKGYQPFVGYNFGAKNFARVKTGTSKAMLWTTLFCIFTSAMFFLFRYPIINAFNTGDADFLKLGVRIISIYGITFITIGYQSAHTFRFMGLGKAKECNIISLSRQGLFYFPAILIMSAAFGLEGIIWAQPVCDLLSLALVIVLANRNKREMPELA